MKRLQLKNWLPSIVLMFILLLLVAATRVYIGAPDGVAVVWKGDLSFSDTVVNLNDYVGVPRKEFEKHPMLLSQMEEMGLFDNEPQKARHRIRKNSGVHLDEHIDDPKANLEKESEEDKSKDSIESESHDEKSNSEKDPRKDLDNKSGDSTLDSSRSD